MKKIILLSSVVEHAAVNRRVVGSSPTGGAIEPPSNGGFIYSPKIKKF